VLGTLQCCKDTGQPVLCDDTGHISMVIVGCSGDGQGAPVVEKAANRQEGDDGGMMVDEDIHNIDKLQLGSTRSVSNVLTKSQNLTGITVKLTVYVYKLHCIYYSLFFFNLDKKINLSGLNCRLVDLL